MGFFQKIKFLIPILFFSTYQLYAGGGDYHAAISSGQFDVIKSHDPSFEGRVEVRKYLAVNSFSPFGGLMANSDGGIFFYAGYFYDIKLFSIFYIQPSFSPGIYFRNRSKNLNYRLEFKSQIEVGMLMSKNSRMGMSFNHISNAGLGPPNPGVESIVFTVSFSVM